MTFGGFQVQIEAKAALASASAHIKHMEADSPADYTIKEGKYSTQELFMVSTPGR